MKIVALNIENFRGIQNVRANNLGDTIIIAGQNGSGKSCIFDAIRLLKSVYGGYQQNEWHQWMGEFAINVNSSSQDLTALFNQQHRPLIIECHIELHDQEKAYFTRNIDDLLIDAVWRMELPDAYAYGGYRMAMFAATMREKEPQVLARATQLRPLLEAELAKPFVTGAVNVQPGGRMTVQTSNVLSVLFSLYKPRDLGLIDYHGAQRHYGRDPAQSINITLDQNDQTKSQNALYNYSNKYQNVKSEMAASFVKDILAGQADVGKDRQESLIDTLKELFVTFFPNKTFLGPVPTTDGNLTFPVTTSGGGRHDLDELSAGEKEILYGYLRIRNSAPRFSIIFIDEPELHLNPRLIRGLPKFYRKNLGLALDNQIWLVTHSDALLREVVGKREFDVFHMQPCGSVTQSEGTITPNMNQLNKLDVNSNVDLALTDLVGDLATYKPGTKAVIFEGGGDTDFDKWMTSTLFSSELSEVNLISGSNKNKVRALHEVLNNAYEKGDIATKFVAVVDRDFDASVEESKAITRFTWPVYHIENFLLEPGVIARVVSPFYQDPVSSEDVLEKLRSCARGSVVKAVRHRVTTFASQALIGAIDLRFDPKVEDIGGAVYEASLRSLERVQHASTGVLSIESLRAHQDEAQTEIETAFADGTWIKRLPGRDILRAYANDLPNGISHETLRNMIVNKMVDEGFVPTEMREVVNLIVAA